MSFLIETGVASSKLSWPRRNSCRSLAPRGAQFIDISQAKCASHWRRNLCTPGTNPNANSAVRSPVDASASQQEANGAAASGGDRNALASSIAALAVGHNSGRQVMEDGAVVVRDDMDKLLQCLPENIREKLLNHPRRSELLEVVLDLGRRPEARFLGDLPAEYLQDEEVTREDLEAAQECVGEFGGDNRAGVEGTLHRISGIRNRRGSVVGLTCRVGRAVTGHVDMIRDLLGQGQSLLFLGRPGVGKTTVIREIARVLADEMHKRVVIVDTSNEIGGDGDVPHPAIGGARRMQVPDPALQHRVMVEAVENHMPQVVIVDEIGTEAEALACRTIAERGVMLVGTAHGQLLENLIKNPTLCDLVGGVQSVTLGDEEARTRGTQKSVLERTAPPTFPVLIEMRERHFWVAHQTDKSVDSLLHGKRPQVEVRTRDSNFKVHIDRRLYDRNGSACSAGSSSRSYSSGGGNGNGSLRGGSVIDDWDDLLSPFGSSGSSERSSEGWSNSGRGGGSYIAEDVDRTYSWAAKIGYVPDKDALLEAAVHGSSSSSNRDSRATGSRIASHSSQSWCDFDEEFHGGGGGGGGGSGYSSSGSIGKRGSKRGPRGIRPR